MYHARARIFVVLCLALLAALVPFSVDADSGDQIAGEVSVWYSDDFEAGRAEWHAYVNTGREQLEVKGNGAERLEHGQRVRLRGRRHGGLFSLGAGSSAVSVDSIDAAASPASGEKHLAVLLINFSDDRRTPWTVDTVNSLLFGAGRSVAAYWRETSGGKLTLTGSVFGWFTLNVAHDDCAKRDTWSNAAQAQAAAAGINLGAFDHLMVAMPRQAACSWGGFANIIGPRSWINGALTNFVVTHELGHNFGAHHASSLTCTNARGRRVSLSRTCRASEYGDPYDVMGQAGKGGATSYHGSNYNLQRWAFLGSGEQVTVAADGRYTLAPSELPGANRSLRIRRPTGNYFYLELRQPFGLFDTFGADSPVANGITIRLVPGTGIAKTKLIDTHPGTASFYDAPLRPGETFTDSLDGVTISVVSLDPARAVIDVHYGAPPTPSPKPPAPPTVGPSAAPPTAPPSTRPSASPSSPPPPPPPPPPSSTPSGTAPKWQGFTNPSSQNTWIVAGNSFTWTWKPAGDGPLSYLGTMVTSPIDSSGRCEYGGFVQPFGVPPTSATSYTSPPLVAGLCYWLAIDATTATGAHTGWQWAMPVRAYN